MRHSKYPRNKLRIAPSGHHRGMHSMINQYLAVCRRYLSKFKEENIIPYMDLSKKVTGYHLEEDVDFLENPWNNYFVQEPLKENEIFWLESCEGCMDLSISTGSNPKSEFIIWKEIKDKYLIIQPHILAKVDDFVNKNFIGKIAAIHIRGTDSFFDKSRPHLPVSFYKELIAEKLQDYSKILICTDSLEILEILKSNFGDKIISYDSEKSTLEKYNFHLSYISENPYKIGEDVIIESLLMSRCDLLIKGTSNVSTFSLIENPYIIVHQVDFKFSQLQHFSSGYESLHSKEYYVDDLEISNMDYYLEKNKVFENKKFEFLDQHKSSKLNNLIKEYFHS
jgi:hypothetical protein